MNGRRNVVGTYFWLTKQYSVSTRFQTDKSDVPVRFVLVRAIRRGLFRATHTTGACGPGTWLPYLTKHRNINGGSSHRSNYIVDFLPLSFLKQRLDRRPTNDNSRGSETSKHLFFVLLGSVYIARLTFEGLSIGNSNGMVRNVLPVLLSAKQ